MSQFSHPHANWLGDIAAEALPETRADFIRKTYGHLAGAVLVFCILEAILFMTPAAEMISRTLFASQWAWIAALVGFMIVQWVAHSWAHSATSLSTQYAGLGVYVVVEALFLCPILYVASTFVPGAITVAAVATAAIFGALTLVAVVSGADFSFLRGALTIGVVGLILLSVGSLIFGWNLGLAIPVIGVVLAGGFILYDTSNVLHHYRIGQHVAASLALFASLAILFYYVLRLAMIFMSED